MINSGSFSVLYHEGERGEEPLIYFLCESLLAYSISYMSKNGKEDLLALIFRTNKLENFVIEANSV